MTADRPVVQHRRSLDPLTRHRVMASIKSRDTRPELALRRALRDAGLRGYRCHLRMPGTPDVAFTRWRVAVFVDGVWWHGHPAYFWPGRRGPYWDQKIVGNMARDRRVDAALQESDWTVLRFWDIDIERSPHAPVSIIRAALAARGREVSGVTQPPAFRAVSGADLA